MEFAIIVEYEAADGQERALEASLVGHARRTLDEEPGCVHFEIMRVTDDAGEPLAGRWLASALFAGEPAMRSYRHNPRLARFEASIAPLAKSRRGITARALAPRQSDRGMRPEQLNAANDD